MDRPRRADASKPKPILQVQDLQVYYGESHALQGVSLTLEHGVLSVVGRNGMGKTTLCNAIVGLTPVRSGSIRFDGRDIVGLDPHAIARAGLGYVSQGRRLWPSLTVEETLRLSAQGDGAWTVDRVYSIFPRLAERRDNGGGQLSGGEQQMLAIGRALMSNPDLLLLDEPTEGLAPLLVREVGRVIAELKRSGLSILLVEQNLGLALSVADRVHVLSRGQIVHTGTPAELMRNEEVKARYLGVA